MCLMNMMEAEDRAELRERNRHDFNELVVYFNV